MAPIRRDAAAGFGGKDALARSSLGRREERERESGKAKRREPRINVKMASLPDVAEQAPIETGCRRAKAQKPDVKLSTDVIAGHQQGMRAPLEQLAKEDTEKKRAGTAKRGG